MSDRLDQGLSVILTLCAIVITGMVVADRVFPHTAADTPQHQQLPEGVWQSLLSGGVRVGEGSSPVQIVEFVDFECPFCARFHDELMTISAESPAALSVTYYHYPLSIHPHAVAAAGAAECSREEDRFAEMVSSLFAEQEQFGTRAWTDYALTAGVKDTLAFSRCLAREDTSERIDTDRAVGRELQVVGTPTLIIDGWLLRRPIGLDSLRWVTEEITAGRHPFEKAGLLTFLGM